MDRKEFLDILSIMNHMAHADGQMHPAEKKVLIAVFKAAKVTPEEQKLIQGRSSLEEMIGPLTPLTLQMQMKMQTMMVCQTSVNINGSRFACWFSNKVSVRTMKPRRAHQLGWILIPTLQIPMEMVCQMAGRQDTLALGHLPKKD